MPLKNYLNPSFIKAALLRRHLCKLGHNAVLHSEARVLNNGDKSDCIEIGSNSHIRGELFTFGHGGQIKIGSNCYVGVNTKIWSGASVDIGNHVLIAHGVSIMDNLTHPINHIERRRHFQDIISSGHSREIDLGDRPITIEDDAWIGANAIIMRGVTIGARAIVSAGSVVRGDVLPDTIVAGNPAKVIKELSN